jgi:subtilisin family serine protease
MLLNLRNIANTLLILMFCSASNTVLASANLSVDLERLITEANRTALIPVIVKFRDSLKITTLRGAVSQQLQYAPKNQQNLRNRRLSLLRNKILTGLKQRAKSPQESLQRLLRQHGVNAELKSLWSINAVALKLPAHLVDEVAKLPGIDRISVDMLLTMNAAPTESVSTEPLWNLEDVNTNYVWNQGYAGEGVVVAIFDSGVDLNHPDLASRWRGGDNSWFDPYGQYDIPVDYDGHGTQAISLVLGGDASGYQVGMAPNAEWIAAKIFDNNNQTSLSAIHEAFQWVLDPDGNPDTNDAPDVVNNSWGFINTINQCYQEFSEDIRLLREAGIAVVFSAGNFGPFTETSISPANDPNVISVGSVDQFQDIERTSSRGPGACDGGVFPKLVAPGSLVFAADILPIAYNVVSGTSFAAPHVTGAITLLKSAFPNATVSQIETALYDSAADLGDSGVDDHYGYGIIDLAGAYDLLFNELGADSPGLLVFNEALYSVDETTEKLIVNVRRLGGSTGEVSIDYTSSDDQAVSSRSGDYSAVSGTLTFADGETLRSFEVEINNDDEDEKNETFYLNLSNPTGDSRIGNRSQVPVTILDDDGPGSLSFGAISYAVSETHSDAKITILRTGGAHGEISAEINLQDDSARLDSDYLALENTIITFRDGEVEKVIDIPLIEDEVYEGNENFIASLLSVDESEIDSPATTTVVILDDDPDISVTSVHMQAVNYTVSESAQHVTLRVLRSGNTDKKTIVEYETVNGSATAGKDYRAKKGQIVFYPKVTQREITLDIHDDSEVETESSFTLVLTSAESDSQIAKPSAAIVRITDDDATSYASLSSSGYSGSSNTSKSINNGGMGGTGIDSNSRQNLAGSNRPDASASGIKIFDLSLSGYAGVDDKSIRELQTLGGNLDESLLKDETDNSEDRSAKSDGKCTQEQKDNNKCEASDEKEISAGLPSPQKEPAATSSDADTTSTAE